MLAAFSSDQDGKLCRQVRHLYSTFSAINALASLATCSHRVDTQIAFIQFHLYLQWVELSE